MTYTTAWGNSSTLSHWERPEMKPASPPTLCWVLNLLSHKGNTYSDLNHWPAFYCYDFFSCSRMLNLLNIACVTSLAQHKVFEIFDFICSSSLFLWQSSVYPLNEYAKIGLSVFWWTFWVFTLLSNMYPAAANIHECNFGRCLFSFFLEDKKIN